MSSSIDRSFFYQGSCSLRLSIFIAVCWLLFLSPRLWSASNETTSGVDSESPRISVLDGKSFSGELGLLGEPALAKDLLEFTDGMFVSKNCEEQCGYTTAPYWMREVEGGVEVLSETPCLKSDATIVWRGTVRGNKIEGTFMWTSKRWYWTIEKEFWFSGELVESKVTSVDSQ